jgi:MFS-type transporter involved in bile tolerance (Atg22 family)
LFSQFTGNPRFGVLSVVILFIIGGAIFMYVPDKYNKTAEVSSDAKHDL